MSKIFEKSNVPDVDLKRNTFDLSFGSHISTKMGQLTPILCKEVLPGDSFEIDSAFGLRFAPMVFPIQTKIHAAVHYFYVRNRNLYDKWMEYIGKTDEDAVPPYRVIGTTDAKSQLGTGSLADYLGVPSTIAGEYANVSVLPLKTTLTTSYSGKLDGVKTITDFNASSIEDLNRVTPLWYGTPVTNPYALIGASNPIDSPTDYFDAYINSRTLWKDIVNTSDNSVYDSDSYLSWVLPTVLPLSYNLDEDGTMVILGAKNGHSDNEEMNVYLLIHQGDDLDNSILKAYKQVTLKYSADNTAWTLSQREIAEWVNEKLDYNTNNYLVFAFNNNDGDKTVQTSPFVKPTDTEFILFGDYVSLTILDTQVRDATDADALAFNPFVGENPKIRLNALPFRAYESIYNSFYRNETVDPLVINGKEVYNDYIRTHEGGADTNLYDLQFRNWESDYFTSCQTSPQQGTAPLVGVSASGTFTFSDGTNTYTAQATIGEDGETITGISTYDESMPKGDLRRMMDAITNGISINDFRNVNSLQRWLETNIRRGYKYVDQIKSHFGITPAFKANDMPEFLGGVHEVVDVNTISNTGDNLGDYAGQASCLGANKHSIHKYCDEHGFIIGILMVYPEPVYSQMLPKMFLKTNNPLDYYFPEFGHIGMQPLTYNEICPIQVAADDYTNNTDTINDVFGYQRAWADYIASNDEVHGDMRTSLSDYVISRTFGDKPELGHDFIAINPDDVNDVFANTEDDAKIYGQMRFNIHAKRPIPRFGIPRIE